MKVDLRVQVAKDDHKHLSHQLHLDIVLQDKTERQYSIPANTAGNRPVVADAQTLALGNDLLGFKPLGSLTFSFKVPKYPLGLKPSESTACYRTAITVSSPKWINLGRKCMIASSES